MHKIDAQPFLYSTPWNSAYPWIVISRESLSTYVTFFPMFVFFLIYECRFTMYTKTNHKHRHKMFQTSQTTDTQVRLCSWPKVGDGHVKNRTFLALALCITVDELFSHLPTLAVSLRLLDTQHLSQWAREGDANQLEHVTMVILWSIFKYGRYLLLNC